MSDDKKPINLAAYGAFALPTEAEMAAALAATGWRVVEDDEEAIPLDFFAYMGDRQRLIAEHAYPGATARDMRALAVACFGRRFEGWGVQRYLGVDAANDRGES